MTLQLLPNKAVGAGQGNPQLLPLLSPRKRVAVPVSKGKAALLRRKTAKRTQQVDVKNSVRKFKGTARKQAGGKPVKK